MPESGQPLIWESRRSSQQAGVERGLLQSGKGEAEQLAEEKETH